MKANATTFFGFAPKDLTGQIYEEVDNQIADAIDAFEQEIRKRSSLPEDSITKSSDDVLNLLHEALDENVDKFEIYVLRNVFVVPDGLAEASANSCSKTSPAKGEDNRDEAPKTEAELNADIRQLTARLKKEKTTGTSLRKEQQRLASDRARLRNILDTLQEVDSNLDSSFIEKSKELLEQTKHLQQSSQQLSELESVLVAQKRERKKEDPSFESMQKSFKAHQRKAGGATTTNLSKSIFR